MIPLSTWRGLRVLHEQDQPVRAGSGLDPGEAHRLRLMQAGQMLAGVVHEINNPLAVILGYSQLLLDRSRDEVDRRDLQCILDETRRLATLVEDMLAYTRRGTDQVETVDLGRVVSAAINLGTHAMRQARVGVVATLPDGGAFVRGSHGAYVQVLLNLLTNARQALTEGRHSERGIFLRVERDEALQCVHLLVANNGPPVPPEDAEAIFQPFYTTKPEHAGTGLGLAVCREIVERYGGAIRLEASAPGEGACFRISFPAA